MTTGMCETSTASCWRRSRPLIPDIRRSSTRQPVLPRWADLKNSSAEANVSTPKPTDRRRFLRDRRSDSSSSTTETTGLSRSSMRPRCPSVHVDVESIYFEAKWSGGKRLPDLGGGGALPVADSGGAGVLGSELALPCRLAHGCIQRRRIDVLQCHP